MKAITLSLLLILMLEPLCAQNKKHAIESEVLTAYPIINVLSNRIYKQFNPNLYYTYQLNPNYKLIFGIAFRENKFTSPCPANYCYGNEINEFETSVGVRRTLWQVNKKNQLFGEASLVYKTLNNSRWGAGGFSGGRTESAERGFGLGSTLRLGYQYNISRTFYFSLNSALNISNSWVEQHTENNVLVGSSYTTIKDLRLINMKSNLIGLRIGYRF